MDKYEFENRIGGGAFGEVFCIEEKTSKLRFAVKKIPLPENEVPSSVFREASIMFDTKCEGVVKLEKVFVDDSYIFFVMELLSKNLSTYLIWHANELAYPNVIKDLMKQMLSTLKYCHSRGVVHRDIKPDNLLLDTQTDYHPVIKIGDFGLSRVYIGVDDGLTPKGTKPQKFCLGPPLILMQLMCGLWDAYLRKWSI